MKVHIRRPLDHIPEGFSITNSGGGNSRYYFRYREEDKIIKFGVPGNLTELTPDEIVSEGIFEVNTREDRWYSSNLKNKIIKWLITKLNIMLYGDNYAKIKKEMNEWWGKEDISTNSKEN